MNPVIVAVAIGTLLSVPALAGGPAVVPVEPVPVVTPAPATHDWSGPYLGLSFGSTSGETQFNPGSFAELDSGSIAGGHAGYLWQRGSLVYGGELAYGDVRDAAFSSFEGVDTALDLKARIGFAANRVLFYGIVGYSQATLYVDGGEWKMFGASYGLGAEFALSDRMTLGLEYLSRDVSGGESSGFPVDADTGLDSVSLRVSFAF